MSERKPNAGDLLAAATAHLPHLWCAAAGWHEPGRCPTDQPTDPTTA